MVKILFVILLIFLMCFNGNSQENLTGNYEGTLSENNDAVIKLQITDADSILIVGNGIYPDDLKFKFQGIIQNMDIDNDFGASFRALLQIQMFNEYVNGFESTNNFIELTFDVEFKVDDTDGMPDVTDEIKSVHVFGIWYEHDGRDPENIDFELMKNK